MKTRRPVVIILVIVALIGLVTLMSIRVPPPPDKEKPDADDLKVVAQIVESLADIKTQMSRCQAQQAEYLPGKGDPSKGKAGVEKLLSTIQQDEDWLSGLERDADKRFSPQARLTPKRLRELVQEWRDNVAPIKENAAKLKSFWQSEERKGKGR